MWPLMLAQPMGAQKQGSAPHLLGRAACSFARTREGSTLIKDYEIDADLGLTRYCQLY
jgi:hypothetical protein